MWLIVDDTRELGCEVIARTSQAGCSILHAMPDVFECLCIDHDLGPNSKHSGKEVIQFALEYNCLPPRVQIVSQNPVGAQNIRNLLTDAGYETKDRINYCRPRKD